MSVVGLWERGRLRPAFPGSLVRSHRVLVIAGTKSHIAALNASMPGDRRTSPVLIIGAGKVGHARHVAAAGVTNWSCSVRVWSLLDRRARVAQRTAACGLGHRFQYRDGVVALDRDGTLVTRLTGDTSLEQRSALVMLGSLEQRRKFAELFEQADWSCRRGRPCAPRGAPRSRPPAS